MKISQKKTVQVDVKAIQICCKVSDRFTYTLIDAEGSDVFAQDDGYVPDFMPGQHFGDYVMLTIELDTGKVLNWTPPSAEDIEKAIKPQDD